MWWICTHSCPPPKVVGPRVKKNKAATALTLLADAVRDSWASPPALPTFEALDLETQLCAWVAAGYAEENVVDYSGLQGCLVL